MFKQHLDDLFQVCVQLIKRCALGMGPGKARHERGTDFEVLGSGLKGSEVLRRKK